MRHPRVAGSTRLLIKSVPPIILEYWIAELFELSYNSAHDRLRRDGPPVLLLYGADDDSLPPSQSI
jgi:hypothetical protein